MRAVTPVDAATISAWRRGLLIFRNQPLSQVIAEVNRYRPGRIVLTDTALSQRPVYAVFHIDRINGVIADKDIAVGTSRVFTFRGGNEILWSSKGNIAAGSASKTLQSAPPARFLIDAETGASLLDMAGLATGGGIGVLQTLRASRRRMST